MWTSDPVGAIGASWSAVASSYGALFRGSIGDPGELVNAIATLDLDALREAFDPLSETLVSTTPLILTGLSVALAFRAGLFNIGAEGQLYIGALLAAIVGFTFTGLPGFIHLPLALIAGFVGGALWGFVPGILKARTGAHEVIVTIMLNFVAYNFINWALKTDLVQREGRPDPISKIIEPSAALPPLIPGLRADWGIIVALVAGLAGTGVILGGLRTVTPGFSPGYGFDGIVVALVGSNRPLGVVAAALLFGALRAGATPMQSATGTPIDIVVIIQALVIMFIAAPALVRAIYRIRAERRVGAEVFAKGWGS
jgi:simple sugar transport system permease protein